MTENMKKLMETLSTNEAAAGAVFACETLESAFTAATAIVGGYTFEEFSTEMEILKNAVLKQLDEELPDKELRSVAGGACDDIHKRAYERLRETEQTLLYQAQINLQIRRL